MKNSEKIRSLKNNEKKIIRDVIFYGMSLDYDWNKILEICREKFEELKITDVVLDLRVLRSIAREYSLHAYVSNQKYFN